MCMTLILKSSKGKSLFLFLVPQSVDELSQNPECSLCHTYNAYTGEEAKNATYIQ